MPKRSSNKKIDNPSQEILTQEEIDKALTEGKNPYAVILGRKGGLKGGKARAEKLSPERRSEIARKAANSRWNKDSQS